MAAAVLGACGDSDDAPSQTELPAPLARAFDRLERAGMEPETLRVGMEQHAALVVDAGEPVVVIAVRGNAIKTFFGPTVIRHDGEPIDISQELICPDGVVAGGGAKQRVIRVSGFCR